MSGLMLIALGALLNSTALVCLRWAERDMHWAQSTLSISLSSLGYLSGGVLAYGLAFLLTLRIMGQNELAFAVPVFVGLQFVFSLLAAHWLFHETLNWPHFAGAVLILLGVGLIASQR